MDCLKKPIFFWCAAVFLLCLMLGASDLWTQEWRWADIVWRMRATHDYLHPNLAGQPYNDKPWLSYWLMVLSSAVGGLNAGSLRLPSVLAGLLTLFATVQFGTALFNRATAYLAAWLLLTTYFFVFWSRVASADMLNVAGMMLAVAWYETQKKKLTFFTYAVFFFILAATALIKGLIVMVLVLLIVLPEMVMTKTIKKHLNRRFLLGLLMGVGIYFLPFYLAHQSGCAESSLYLVYRENILRFFAPFDHQGPWYTYFIYLPLYLLPWSVIALGVWGINKKNLLPRTSAQNAFLISTLFIFVFFTLSGSRRSYYILPMVPLVMLWVAYLFQTIKNKKNLYRVIAFFYVLLLCWFAYVQPLYYRRHGVQAFAAQIKQSAAAYAPWSTWSVVMIASDDRVGFYLAPIVPSTSFRSFEDFKKSKLKIKRPAVVVLQPAMLLEITKQYPASTWISPPKNTSLPAVVLIP